MECLVMCQRYRRGFTAAEKTELWDRWQRVESLKEIGRAFGKPSSSIHLQVSPHGGIRPAPRRRSRLSLTLSEREEISRGLAVDQSARSMARLLGRSASTVSLCGSTRDRAPPPTGWPTSNQNRWPTSVGTGGRLQIGISGRLQIGMGGRLASESAPKPRTTD